MSSSRQPRQGRRDFLTSVATATAAIGAMSLMPGSAGAQPSAAAAAPLVDLPFDDSWTQRLRSVKHKAVFDSATVEEGMALEQASTFMAGYHEQFGTSDAETVPVVVMRHMGTVLAFNDSIWKAYSLGEMVKLDDPQTGTRAVRNPFAMIAADDAKALVTQGASLDSLRARGAILLACNKATRNFAGRLAKRDNKQMADVYEELKANLLPGVLLQPSGVYAVIRAQEAGCAAFKST